ncbi:RIP metalloprotease RseP [Palleronia caenipelagi]|uniref:Zinc metalloprotease n=1 Tax=Palleronia caenipelagi TaxID=2489174 RepID=A0A547Q647_9RHOB|nr:RIP metalloprotease RseP [Palleronia caenipelagi]TRD21847.1 RIP metalloprotease RseP [Palleronia caenipelagi]
MPDFLPDFGSLIFTIGAFIAALSIIVAIHEYGHYIVGRWSGIQADVFSIGMGPVLASRVDKRGTRWQIAAFPVGGYVKFRGDANAASVGSDPAPQSAAERRETMSGAPLWARTATVAAGPVFNFILSILVFAIVLSVRGVTSDPVTIERQLSLPGAEAVLQQGDELIAIAGLEVTGADELGAVLTEVPVEERIDYEIRRFGDRRIVEGPFPLPAIVGGVTPKSAAAEAGLVEGDVIRAVDGEPVVAFETLRDLVGNSDGSPMRFSVWRPGAEQGGEEFDVTLTPKRMDLPTADGGFETRWLIGVTAGAIFELERSTPGPLAALGYGVDQTIFIVKSSLSGLYHMAIGAISSCNLQGPVGIAETSGAAASAGLLSFVWFIAVLSTAIGLMNLFPIPILDGGHLVFYAYEAITGRAPSERALNALMVGGLALLLSLMAFALTNDLFCP